MKKIAVVTGTRAEYGLLKNTLIEINRSKALKLQLIVTGAHLADEFGLTINEIIGDSFDIEEKIPILMRNNAKDGISKEMGMLMIQLSQTFERIKPDVLLILGDRYEIFAAASVAMVMNIPIAHISGGEITEGAIDEQIRHAITKMAHIHFPGAEIYAKNIINMGEEPWRVFNVGDVGIEAVKNSKLFTSEELKEELRINVDSNTLLVTYHPVTLERDTLPQQMENLTEALNETNKDIIITYPNTDNGGEYIIKKLEEFQRNNTRVHLYKNLGILKYLSVMKLCGALVGNSSSGIVEAPYLKVPVVNIGNRQRGRMMAENIICCDNNKKNICEAIEKACSIEFKNKVKNVKSLYGEGNTSKEIVKVLETIDINSKLLKKKLKWG